MGIDIGSTTIKAVIYDKFGNIISVGRVKTGNPEIVKDSGSSAGYQRSI